MAENTPTVISRADAIVRGLKRYFTGGICPSGHVAERFVSNRKCSICNSRDKKAWSRKNKNSVASYNKQHYAKNADVARRRSRAWRQNNPEKFKAQKRRDYARNKSAYLRRNAHYRQINAERLKEIDRSKVALNPERYRSYKRNYKARKRKASGRHTASDVLVILKRQRGKCAVCRLKLSKYHVDHITPLSRGGSNDKINLQVLCGPCNQSKGAKDPIKFMQQRGLLL